MPEWHDLLSSLGPCALVELQLKAVCAVVSVCVRVLRRTPSEAEVEYTQAVITPPEHINMHGPLVMQ